MINPLRFGVSPIDEDWNLRQRQGGGDAKELHHVRSLRQTMRDQLYDRDRWGEEREIIDIVLQAVMPPPPTAFSEDCSDIYSLPSVTGIVSEWGVEGIFPSHLIIDHIGRNTWKAPPSRFDVTYSSFWGSSGRTIDPDDDERWRDVPLPSDDSDWDLSDNELEPFTQLPTSVCKELPEIPQATDRGDDSIELLAVPFVT